MSFVKIFRKSIIAGSGLFIAFSANAELTDNFHHAPEGLHDFSSVRNALSITPSDLNKNIIGISTITPWSGSWFPFRKNKMVEGIIDDHSRYLDKKDPDYKRTPFEKYALFVKKKYGKSLDFDPYDAVVWEKTNHTFEFDDNLRKPKVVTVFDWRGHCDGLAAASVLFNEPMFPVEKEGITFTPGDQKALLTELSKLVGVNYLGQKVVPESESEEAPAIGPSPDFLPLEFAKEQGKDFKTLLNKIDDLKIPDLEMMFDKNTIERLNEYLTVSALYEKISVFGKIYLSKESKTYESLSKDLRAKPFASLSEKEQHVVKKFNRAMLKDKFGDIVPAKIVIGPYEDVNPADFHAALIHYIKNLKIPFGMDFEPGEKVHNHPVYQFVSYIMPTTIKNRFMVTTDIVYAHYGTEAGAGTNVAVKTYYYDLYTDNTGHVVGGEWSKNRFINRFEEDYRRGLVANEQFNKITHNLNRCSIDPTNLFCEDKRMVGISSVNDHPDFLWTPYQIVDNPLIDFYSVYEEEKFFNGKTPEALLSAIKALNLNLRMPKESLEDGPVANLSPIEQLNGILEAPNLYDELMRVFPNMHKTNEMKVLEDDTDIARAFAKDAINMEDANEIKIIKLNRLALDTVFPKESPKRKFEASKNPYIREIFVRDIINVGKDAGIIDNFDPTDKLINSIEGAIF